MKKAALVVTMIVLAACTARPMTVPTASPSVPVKATPGNTPDQIPSAAKPTRLASATIGNTASPTQTNTPTLASTFTSTATATIQQICSPLQDIAIEELSSILTTPYQAASPGQDNGHQGVDFAYYHRGSHTVMLGLPVYSSLAGKVAAVILDRPPYGNAIIIETPLTTLTPELLAGLQLPFQSTPPAIDGRLTCPTPAATPAWLPDPSSPLPLTPDRYSLYLLYAHLNKPPLLALGDEVTCGQQVGEVGTTGNSVNPHLHLETRLGPSGATFTSLAHYLNTATIEEMSSYCTWRVSGIFQAFDPMLLFDQAKRSK